MLDGRNCLKDHRQFLLMLYVGSMIQVTGHQFAYQPKYATLLTPLVSILLANCSLSDLLHQLTKILSITFIHFHVWQLSGIDIKFIRWPILYIYFGCWEIEFLNYRPHMKLAFFPYQQIFLFIYLENCFVMSEDCNTEFKSKEVVNSLYSSPWCASPSMLVNTELDCLVQWKNLGGGE